MFLIAFSTRSALSLVAHVTKMTALPAVRVEMQSVLLFVSVKRIHALGATTVLTCWMKTLTVAVCVCSSPQMSQQ